MGKTINLDDMGRAFAYCVWGANVDDWRRFRSGAGDNRLARHLALYPGQSSPKLRMAHRRLVLFCGGSL